MIYVVDNKGRNELIKHTEFNAAPAHASTSVISNALRFVFENGASSLAGTITGNPLYSWTLGAIFATLNGIPSNVISSGSTPLYRIFVSSQTMMRYIYIKDGSSWKLIESAGYVHYKQTNVFVGTINGKIEQLTASNEWSSNTCKDAKYALDDYFKYKVYNPNYMTIRTLGTMKLKGINTTLNFAPVFYQYPGYIN